MPCNFGAGGLAGSTAAIELAPASAWVRGWKVVGFGTGGRSPAPGAGAAASVDLALLVGGVTPLASALRGCSFEMKALRRSAPTMIAPAKQSTIGHLGPRGPFWLGSTGWNCSGGAVEGSAFFCAALARFNASLIKL